MAFKNYINPGSITIIQDRASRDDVLKKVAELAVRSGNTADIGEDRIFQKLKERETLGSTAIGEGIAIPHCGFEEVRSFVVGLVVLKTGIDFDSPDGKPTDLFFFIIGPLDKRNEHVQILSEITRSARDQEILRCIRDASTHEEIAEILEDTEEFGSEVKEQAQASNLTVYIQEQSVFDAILELFTAEPECYITVLEGNSAGKYLHHLPLFASFWTDDEPETIRIISAQLRKAACNNMIRRINAIRDTSTEDAGILVTVQDLAYWTGNLSM